MLVPFVVYVLFPKYQGAVGAGSGPVRRGAVAISVRPLHCLAREVAKGACRIIAFIPGNDDPRACRPAPSRLMRLGGDSVFFDVKGLNFRRA